MLVEELVGACWKELAGGNKRGVLVVWAGWVETSQKEGCVVVAGK